MNKKKETEREVLYFVVFISEPQIIFIKSPYFTKNAIFTIKAKVWLATEVLLLKASTVCVYEVTCMNEPRRFMSM